MGNAMRSGWLTAAALAGLLLTLSLSIAAFPVCAQGARIPGTTGPGSWFLLKPMPHPQNEAATAVLDGKIYVIGGFEKDGDPTTRVQVYDPSTDTWSEGPSLKETIHHAGAAVAGGRIYLVGGFRIHSESAIRWIMCGRSIPRPGAGRRRRRCLRRGAR